MARKRKGAHPQPKSPARSAQKPAPKSRPPEPHARARRPARKPVRRTPAWVPALATIGAIAVLVVAFLAIRYFNTPAAPAPAGETQTSQVLSTITGLPASELEQVGMGSANNTVKPVSGTVLTGPAGKPLVFYYGAEYCPFCAAERWAIVVALSRFGSFSGLKTTTSSSTDVYPDLATFTFHGATYSSQYLEFQTVETTDRDQHKLETPTTAQQALISHYDPDGTIPFVDFANRYTFNGATYKPDSLQGLTWTQTAADLQNPSSPQAQGILGSANLITAVLCKLTSDQPASVCSGAAIKSIEAHL